MANQIQTQAYGYAILGDGQSTSVSFDINSLPNIAGVAALGMQNPDSIYLTDFSGTPMPVPNITSLTIKGSVVTIQFDSALIAFNPINGNGVYGIDFYLGFNC